jgi:hypothetical protein
MADAQLVKRANEVIERLFALNEAMESADAFCEIVDRAQRPSDGTRLGRSGRRGSPRSSDPLGSRRNCPGGHWDHHGMS